MKWSQWNCIAPLWRQSCFPSGSAGKNLTAVQKTQETRVWSLGWEDTLGKEMATHSSILAWRIPWMEEPGGLPSMGSQRVRHNWVTNTFTFTICTHGPLLTALQVGGTGSLWVSPPAHVTWLSDKWYKSECHEIKCILINFSKKNRTTHTYFLFTCC